MSKATKFAMLFLIALPSVARAQKAPTRPLIPPQFAPRDPKLDGTAQDRAQIVVALAEYRRSAMGDTTRIRRCDAQRLVVDSAAIDAVERQWFNGTSLLQNDASACAPRPEFPFRQGRSIAIASIDVTADTSAVAWISVRAVDAFHKEKFFLKRRGSLQRFVVMSAELGSRFYVR